MLENTAQQSAALHNSFQPLSPQECTNKQHGQTVSSTVLNYDQTSPERRDRIRTLMGGFSPSAITAAMRRDSPRSGVVKRQSPSRPSASRARLGFMDTPTISSQLGRINAPPPFSRQQPDAQQSSLSHDGASGGAASPSPPQRSPQHEGQLMSSPTGPISAEFRFGGQQVFVSGPPMFQQLQIHPDGSVSTLHTPNRQSEVYSSPRLGLDPPTINSKLSHGGSPSGAFGTSPLMQPPASSTSSPISGHPSPQLMGESAHAWGLHPQLTPEGQILAKYKRAKKLLQAQLHENDVLRQHLAEESKRSAVSEARMGAMANPAEMSGLLMQSQADRLVAISKLHEAQAQIDQLKGNVHTLKGQAALSESDQRELLEAFTHERAKRESEALDAHRALESKLRDVEENLRLSELDRSKCTTREMALLSKVTGLEALLEASIQEAKVSKEREELESLSLHNQLSQAISEQQRQASQEIDASKASHAQEIAALEEQLASVRHEVLVAREECEQGRATRARLEEDLDAALSKLHHTIKMKEDEARSEADVRLELSAEIRASEPPCSESADFRPVEEDIPTLSDPVCGREDLIINGMGQSHGDKGQLTHLAFEEQHTHEMEGICSQEDPEGSRVQQMGVKEQLTSLTERLQAEMNAAVNMVEGNAALKLADAESELAKLRLEISNLEEQLEKHREGRIAALEALQGAHEVSLLQMMAVNREALTNMQLCHQRQLEEIRLKSQQQAPEGEPLVTGQAQQGEETSGMGEVERLKHRVCEIENDLSSAAQDAARAAAKHSAEISEMWSMHLYKVKEEQARAEMAEARALQLEASEQQLVAHLITSHAIGKAKLNEEWMAKVELEERRICASMIVQRQSEAEMGLSELQVACKVLTQSLESLQQRNEELEANNASLGQVNEDLREGQEALKRHLLAAEAAAAAMSLTHGDDGASQGRESLSGSTTEGLAEVSTEGSTEGSEVRAAGGLLPSSDEDGQDMHSARLDEEMQRAELAEESHSKLQKQMHDHMVRYEALQEDLDTSLAESEGYAEQLAATQRQVRQYEARILQYERDFDSVAEDLEVMHGKVQEAERKAAAAEKCEAKAISDLLDIRESLKEVAEPSTCSDMATPQGAIEDNAKALAMASLHLEQLQREMHGLRAIVKQLHADLMTHQRDASIELSSVAQDSKSQLSALDLDIKLLNRQALHQLEDQRETLTVKIAARDDMIAKLYSQLSDIRSAADQDRMALKMAEVAVLQGSSQIRELVSQVEDHRREAEETRSNLEVSHQRFSEQARQVTRFRHVSAQLEQQLRELSEQSRQHEVERSRMLLEMNGLRELLRDARATIKKLKGAWEVAPRGEDHPVGHQGWEIPRTLQGDEIAEGPQATNRHSGNDGAEGGRETADPRQSTAMGVVSSSHRFAPMDEALLALEIFSAAMSVTAAQRSATRPKMAAAVTAAAAAGGITEEELRLLISPAGLEYMQRQLSITKQAIEEARGAQEKGSSAGVRSSRSSMSKEGGEIRLRESHRQIAAAMETIREALKQHAWVQARVPRAPEAISVGSEDGTKQLASSARIVAAHPCPSASIQGPLAPAPSSSDPKKISAMLSPWSTPLPGGEAEAKAFVTPPGSSPPAPRQWAWPALSSPAPEPLPHQPKPHIPHMTSATGQTLAPLADKAKVLSAILKQKCSAHGPQVQGSSKGSKSAVVHNSPIRRGTPERALKPVNVITRTHYANTVAFRTQRSSSHSSSTSAGPSQALAVASESPAPPHSRGGGQHIMGPEYDLLPAYGDSKSDYRHSKRADSNLAQNKEHLETRHVSMPRSHDRSVHVGRATSPLPTAKIFSSDHSPRSSGLSSSYVAMYRRQIDVQKR